MSWFASRITGFRMSRRRDDSSFVERANVKMTERKGNRSSASWSSKKHGRRSRGSGKLDIRTHCSNKCCSMVVIIIFSCYLLLSQEYDLICRCKSAECIHMKRVYIMVVLVDLLKKES